MKFKWRLAEFSDYYEVNGIKYWLHFNGECKPNFERIKTDFYKFTQTQLSFWGSIPVSEYHFIFQILHLLICIKGF